MSKFIDTVPGVVWQAAFTLVSALLVWQFGDGEQIVMAIGALAMVLKIVGVNVGADTKQPQSSNAPIGTRSVGSSQPQKSKTARILWG